MRKERIREGKRFPKGILLSFSLPFLLFFLAFRLEIISDLEKKIAKIVPGISHIAFTQLSNILTSDITIAPLSKIRNHIVRYCWLQTLFKFNQFCRECPFPGPNPGFHTASGHTPS